MQGDKMKPAILGGEPVRRRPFPPNHNLGPEEHEAVKRVLNSGIMSGYRGSYGDAFMGGREVQALEDAWVAYIGTKYALAVNSATTGLQMACEALEVGPGDAVVVAPYSMSCSATVPAKLGADVLFADIDAFYCMDYSSLETLLTRHRVKAVIAVSLFGQPINRAIYNLCSEHKTWLIEDAAQAPGAYYPSGYSDSSKVGSLADLSVFSLTTGKHMSCGEGGIITTNHKHLADRIAGLRNHAEAVAHSLNSYYEWIGDIGGNYRMTELQAAIALEQLKKFPELLNQRRANVDYLADRIGNNYQQITPVLEAPGTYHSYYVQPFRWHGKIRSKTMGPKEDHYCCQCSNRPGEICSHCFVEAVSAELPGGRAQRPDLGSLIGCGYVDPLDRLPVFEYGLDQGPKLGYCSHVYRASSGRLITSMYHAPAATETDMEDVATAFYKVLTNQQEIRQNCEQQTREAEEW